MNHSCNIAVIGLGHVGFPLAITLARTGFSVFGIDVREDRIQSLLDGKSYTPDISDEDIVAHYGKTFFPGTDYAVIAQADVVVMCVPTPLDAHKAPDLSFLKSASESLVLHLKKGQLVIVESTTYPGCTEEYIQPILEKGGLKAGTDFFLAFSPERIDPGNNTPFSSISKIVAGCNKESMECAALFYDQFTKRSIVVSSMKVAEMAKLLENVFRLVNISFVNEFKMLCDKMDIDVWEVIEAAKTKPYGFMPFYPGPGVGGECIPLDPFYLTWKGKEYGFYARFIELAGEINESMPHHTVARAAWILNKYGRALQGSTILLLGVAYKKNIGDIRESPAVKMYSLLKEKKADVYYHDPYVETFTMHGETISSIVLDDAVLRKADLVCILTDHSLFEYERIVKNSRCILDTRNAIKEKYPHVFK